jgi:prephenate dehydrogenase
VRIAVLGVGLIGGSIALAARERLGAEVVGYDSSPEAARTARKLGALDYVAADPGAAAAGADAAFVAVPVGVLPATVAAVLAAAGESCVVTDVGSTMRLLQAAHADPRFVGGHPLAGAETAGVRHARADLFDDATWYLTPTSQTSGMLLDRLYRLLRDIAACPVAIDAVTHDTILAAVSHLPHVLANVLVTHAARALDAKGERLPAVGPSFRDATRVAGAPSRIWRDIYLANADVLAGQIDETISRLGMVRDALIARDAEAIVGWNDGAAEDRRRLIESGLGGGTLHELRASVPNRPGVVAEVALELGRAGVNIVDMALYPAPDMSEGVIALWVAGDAPARRAEELVARLGFPVARP